MRRRILLAEDHDHRSHQRLKELLETEAEVHVDVVGDADAALHALAGQCYSIFLLDILMPGMAGMKLIEEIQRRNVPSTVIVMTSQASIDQAVQAMRLGAYDVLTKPIDLEHARLVVQRVLRERRLRDEISALREKLQQQYSFRNIISKNPRMHAIFELIGNVAQTNSTVLVEGETGTGKEQIARAIHQASEVRTGPLIAVNCAALPETLLESELFGHERGSFTSAISQRVGRFELANGGTIFLDEVGDIPPAMQAKLLRVLQERRFERVGGAESIEADVRVVAATNRSLMRLVRRGQFREDLFYRLNVVRVDLPPLRERPEDIPLLVGHFCQRFARPGKAPAEVSAEAMEVLLRCPWPGNVRQLENAVERACVTARDGVIRPHNLPPDVAGKGATEGRPGLAVDLNRPLPEQLAELTAAFEERYLRKALRKTRGHVGKCAALSGLSRRSITDKITLYKIDKEQLKRD